MHSCALTLSLTIHSPAGRTQRQRVSLVVVIVDSQQWRCVHVCHSADGYQRICINVGITKETSALCCTCGVLTCARQVLNRTAPVLAKTDSPAEQFSSAICRKQHVMRAAQGGRVRRAGTRATRVSRAPCALLNARDRTAHLPHLWTRSVCVLCD
jgi:hypothetical protein